MEAPHAIFHTEEGITVCLSQEGLRRCAADNALLRSTVPTEKRSHKIAATGLLVVIVTALAWGVVQVWQEGGLS